MPGPARGSPSSFLRFGHWLEPRLAPRSSRRRSTRCSPQGRPFNMHRAARSPAATSRPRAASPAAAPSCACATSPATATRSARDHRPAPAASRATSRSSRALLDALPHAGLAARQRRTHRLGQQGLRAGGRGATSRAEVRERQIELLEPRQRDELRARYRRGDSFSERVPLIVGGERKSHDVIVMPASATRPPARPSTSPRSRSAQGEHRPPDRRLRPHARPRRDRRRHLQPRPAAVFFNDAYRKLWQLDADWLASRPSHGEVLDRLRELGRLPEVVNYREWKTKVLACYKTGVRARGLVAPARRPHRCTSSPRSGPTAASPISTTTTPSGSRSKAATTP